MSRVISNALKIALPYSLLVAAAAYVASLRFVVVFASEAQQQYTGWGAVVYLVSPGGA